MTMNTRPLHALLAALLLLSVGCEPPNAPEVPGEASDPSSSSQADTPQNMPLDLTIDRDALFELDANGEQIDTDERADLPELVGPDNDKRLRVNGGVITNEEAIGLRDRVDGAEVSFELKTD